jgi:hypothetical protein
VAGHPLSDDKPIPIPTSDVNLTGEFGLHFWDKVFDTCPKMTPKAPSSGDDIPDLARDGHRAIGIRDAATAAAVDRGRLPSWRWGLDLARSQTEIDPDSFLGFVAAAGNDGPPPKSKYIDWPQIGGCRPWGRWHWRPLRHFLRSHRLSLFTCIILILIASAAAVALKKNKMGRIPRAPWFGVLSGKIQT